MVNLIVRIPDQLAARLTEAGGDLERKALEALALEEYRAGRLTSNEVRQALDFGSLDEFDGFLKAHGIFEEYTVADMESERQAFDRLGL